MLFWIKIPFHQGIIYAHIRQNLEFPYFRGGTDFKGSEKYQGWSKKIGFFLFCFWDPLGPKKAKNKK